MPCLYTPVKLSLLPAVSQHPLISNISLVLGGATVIHTLSLFPLSPNWSLLSQNLIFNGSTLCLDVRAWLILLITHWKTQKMTCPKPSLKIVVTHKLVEDYDYEVVISLVNLLQQEGIFFKRYSNKEKARRGLISLGLHVSNN